MAKAPLSGTRQGFVLDALNASFQGTVTANIVLLSGVELRGEIGNFELADDHDSKADILDSEYGLREIVFEQVDRIELYLNGTQKDIYVFS